MRYLAIICSLLFFSACKNKTGDEIDQLLDAKKLSIEQKLEKFLENDLLSEYDLSEEQIDWLKDFYSSRKYSPFWHEDSVLNKAGEEMSFLVDHSLYLGIPSNRIDFNGKKESNPVIHELLLTARSAILLHDLKYGLFEDTVKIYKPVRFPIKDEYSAFLKKPDSLSYENQFIYGLHSDTNYVFLAKHLFQYCTSNRLDTNCYAIPTFKEDSIQSLELSEQALRSKGYLKDTLSFEAALKWFQKDNGLTTDAKLGKNTVEALNESSLNKVLRMALTLDKIRRSSEYPKKYIIINIPEYILRYYAVDSLKSVHRIIVGTRENQTPELRSRLHTVMVYPFWNVPYSIASKEILPAVQRNINYLSRNNYRVYRGEAEINPKDVNWKKIKKNSFPYKIVQDPGPENSLGIIKFEFHNKYSVYFHDTPSKGLFSTTVRSYSHGCMRTESPGDLAKLILSYDSVGRKANPITADSLDSLIALAQNYPIKLKAPVTVYIEYRTATANRDELTIHLDIYKRDEEYLKIMRVKYK